MISTLIALLLGAISFLYFLNRIRSTSTSTSTRRSVALIVLGDFTRSPRMMYHAQSLLKNGYQLNIIAYRGSSSPPQEFINDDKCRLLYLPQPLPWTSKLPKSIFLLLAPIKVLLGAFYLLSALVWTIKSSPGYMFVQNPPSIPTLPVVQLAAFLRGSRVIIDWHNTGYSMLSLRLGEKHPIVRIAKLIEYTFGRNAYAHLMVTEAMRRELVKDARLQGQTVAFHDRPPHHFRKQTPSESHKLFSRLASLESISFPSLPPPPDSTQTLFTTSTGSHLPSRPALLITSTSHTPDEDLSILLRALSSYEISARSARSSNRNLPRIVMLVTGKGQGKLSFEREVQRIESEESWEWVRVRTEWLTLEDYPKLLGSGDLGISLHTSTSGFDLPMKVVDMFGCELPVLALDFKCIGELVQDGINGKTFRNHQELAQQLIDLLEDFPNHSSPSKLETLRKGINQTEYGVPTTADSDDVVSEGDRGKGRERRMKWNNWEENWDEIVLPLLDTK